jgi:hypothetical protein
MFENIFSNFISRSQILGRNWEKVRRGFPLAIQTLPPLGKSGLKMICHVNIVYGNLKSDNSQDYAQKPQRNCTFMNAASVGEDIWCCHKWMRHETFVP